MPTTIVLNGRRYVTWRFSGEDRLEYRIGLHAKGKYKYGSLQLGEIILPLSMVGRKIRLKIEEAKEEDVKE